MYIPLMKLIEKGYKEGVDQKSKVDDTVFKITDDSAEGVPDASADGVHDTSTDGLPYGEIVGQGELLCTKQKRGGAPYAVQHPDGMIYNMVRESDWFVSTMKRALNQFPCTKESPWRLIVYHDGSSQTRSRVDISVVHVRYVCVTACIRGYTSHMHSLAGVYILPPWIHSHTVSEFIFCFHQGL